MKKLLTNKKRRRRENIWGVLFCLPCILGFIFFALIPMCTSLYYSFTDYNVISKCNFIGPGNYANMFSGTDPYFYKSLTVTCIYVALSVPSSLIVAFMIALLLNADVKGKGVFRTIFYLPSIVPVVAMSAVWLWIFNSDFGLVNMLLKAVGLPTCQWLSSEKTVIPTLVFTNLWTVGSTMVIFLAGIQDVPKQLMEAVEIDGGGGIAKLFHVIIPLMTPTIFYNLVMGIINGFQVFTQAYVITQGGPNNASLFYVYYLYREAFRFMRMGSACAIAWILFGIIMLLTAAMFKLQKKWVYYGGQ
ncbi:MAG: carbohydrate ABC transporter permease [Oribacterium sp.]|uniref:carbohydrate ABC transporter permease n=1 Tax=Oribacterium sp. oral taxon 102 TaxID=671214 RepID=UPI002ED4CD6B